MSPFQRIRRHGRLAVLIAALYPTLQDAVSEALNDVFTARMPALPGPSWLAIPLSLMASVALGKIPGLADRGARALLSRWRGRGGGGAPAGVVSGG